MSKKTRPRINLSFNDQAPPQAFEEVGPTGGEGEGLGLGWRLAPILGNGLDAYGTSMALKNNPNAREYNPLIRPFAHNDPALYASKLAIGALGSEIANRTAKRGNKRAAKIQVALTTLLPALAGVLNLGVAKRGKKK